MDSVGVVFTISGDLERARAIVASIDLPIPTDFRTPTDGLDRLADLLKVALCFPECEATLREQAALLYPQNWPIEAANGSK